MELNSAQARALARIFEQAVDHHSESENVYDLDLLANNAAAVDSKGGSFGEFLKNPLIAQVIASALAALVAKLTAPKPQKTEAPAPRPAPAPAPPPPPPAEDPAEELQLEAWPEEAWHDWFKTDENKDGHFDIQAELAAGKAIPNGSVIRFMVGIKDPNGGPAKVPTNHPEETFPVVKHSFVYSGGESFSFDSSDQPGSKQPVPGLGHVQGGPVYQKSSGWDFIIRLNKGGPKRTLRYQGSVGASASNPVDVVIGKAK